MRYEDKREYILKELDRIHTYNGLDWDKYVYYSGVPNYIIHDENAVEDATKEDYVLDDDEMKTYKGMKFILSWRTNALTCMILFYCHILLCNKDLSDKDKLKYIGDMINSAIESANFVNYVIGKSKSKKEFREFKSSL